MELGKMSVNKIKEFNTATDRIAGVVFSVLFLLNICYYTVGTMSVIWEDIGNIFKALAILVAAFIVLQLIFGLLHKLFNWFSKAKMTRVAEWSGIKFFFIAWAVIFISCLICAIIRYPAGMEYDGAHQLLQAFGVETLTAHWPPFSTILMSLPIRIMYDITGDIYASVFTQAIVQALISSCVMAYAVAFIKKLKISPIFAVVATLIVAIVPVFPGFMTAIVKDTYYAVAIVWLLTLLGEMLFLDEKHFVLIGISALLVSLLRNNGIYLIIVLAIASILIKEIQRKERIIVCATFGAVCLICVVYSNVMLPALGINKTTISEALSIPFQQTARYYRDYAEDVTTEENEIIGKVLDTDIIGQIYDPYLSDEVKNTYKGNDDALPGYFGVWLGQFFKHPICYLDATLENTYGFWGPLAESEEETCDAGMYSTQDFFTVTGHGNIQWRDADAYSRMMRWSVSWNDGILGKPLCNYGIQIWIMLYIFINVLVKRHNKLLLIMLPIFLSWIICLAAPTWWHNGFRYALPIIFFNPILVAMHWYADHGPMPEVKFSRQQRRQAKEEKRSK